MAGVGGLSMAGPISEGMKIIKLLPHDTCRDFGQSDIKQFVEECQLGKYTFNVSAVSLEKHMCAYLVLCC